MNEINIDASGTESEVEIFAVDEHHPERQPLAL